MENVEATLREMKKRYKKASSLELYDPTTDNYAVPEGLENLNMKKIEAGVQFKRVQFSLAVFDMLAPIDEEMSSSLPVAPEGCCPERTF
jgi:hypothetical protein